MRWPLLERGRAFRGEGAYCKVLGGAGNGREGLKRKLGFWSTVCEFMDRKRVVWEGRTSVVLHRWLRRAGGRWLQGKKCDVSDRKNESWRFRVETGPQNGDILTAGAGFGRGVPMATNIGARVAGKTTNMPDHQNQHFSQTVRDLCTKIE